MVKRPMRTSAWTAPVSYTHLDVYKRQARLRSEPDALLSGTELVPGLAGALLRTLDPS